jgi:hypothetical protein
MMVAAGGMEAVGWLGREGMLQANIKIDRMTRK